MIGPYTDEGTKDVVAEPETGKLRPYPDEGIKDVVTEPGTGKLRPNAYEGLEWMGESVDIEVSDSEVKKNLCNCINTLDEDKIETGSTSGTQLRDKTLASGWKIRVWKTEK